MSGIFICVTSLTSLEEQLNRRQALQQAAEEGSKVKAKFLSMMTHEICTPLHLILKAVEMLSDSDGDKVDILSVITTAAEHVLDVLQDLMRFKVNFGASGPSLIPPRYNPFNPEEEHKRATLQQRRHTRN